LNDAFDPTATSLSKRADAAGRHGLIKPVQERRSDESSIPACGVISAYGLGLAVKQPSWTISLFDAGRRVRVGSPRNEIIGSLGATSGCKCAHHRLRMGT